MNHKRQLLALFLLCATQLTHAGEKEELLKLKNTTTNLIKQLVKQGILTDKMAAEMIKQAETESTQQVAEAKAVTPVAPAEAVPADEVRVAYVPEFVKDEIRQQVRTELKNEVVSDVMQKAKQEKWGLPGSLPEWVNRFKLSGDIRLREQSSFMASNNAPNGSYLDWPTINSSGGLTNAGQNALVNTTDGHNVGRERVRLGIDANIADNVDAGMRLATGNISNPISTNQAMGTYGGRYTFNIDRAFLRYKAVDDNKFNWLTVMGGRTPNPFFTGGSNVVWDEDLSFEGIMGTVRHQLRDSELSMASSGKGPVIFGTAGVFPLQESTGMNNRTKWLLGGQTGVDWGFDNQDKLTVAAAYYHYENTTAVTDPRLNVVGSTCSQATSESVQSAPQFMQTGNTLTPICNGDANGNLGLMGLASKFQILNFNALYDLALFSPHHLKFGADYAQNIGFNSNEIMNNYKTVYTAGSPYNIPINSAGTYAWQVRADLGWPTVDVGGHWNVFSLYKYVGSDAVLDAYTDSDFHQGGASNLGGTNVKGWVLGGNYGLMKNIWLTGRWMSASVINGPQYNVDLMQLDINTHF